MVDRGTHSQEDGTGNGSETRGQSQVHLGIGKSLDEWLGEDTVLSLTDEGAGSSSNSLGTGKSESLGEEPGYRLKMNLQYERETYQTS